MSQVDVTRQFNHVQSGAWPAGKSDLEILTQRDTLNYRNGVAQPLSSELHYDTSVVESLHIPQLQHQRVRALHGDHQPLYIAPPPAHFFPSFPSQSSPTYSVFEQKSLPQTPPKAPPLIRSQSAIELPSTRNFGQQAKPNSITRPPPVLATSSNATPAPPATTTPTKGKRGRKPKDPVAHAAKKEAKEKKRLEKEAAMAELTGQQIVFIPEDITAITARIETVSRPSTSGLGQSRPSSSANSESRPTSSGTEGAQLSLVMNEQKKRSADDAFLDESGLDASLWLDTEESSLDLDSSWTMSTPLTSPISSPQSGGLGIFLHAPPSTPIDELLSSSAQLGINPALLFQEDSFTLISHHKTGKLARALKSPLEIMAIDEYPLAHSTISSNPPSTPSEDSNKKLGLMDLMLHRNESEDKPSPKKKLRPDLVFSTTKRGKAVVSLQKNAPTEEPTTPVRETPDTETDLRSLVLKRRKEVWGDEVGMEVTRIAVHRRLTSRKTSTGLMSPLSPKSSTRRDIRHLESDSDSSDSSDSEDDESPPPAASQVTPIATPTNPLTGASMQKSFSAPGFFASEIFSCLPTTPSDELPLAPKLNQFDVENMRCKTCGMLFRKQTGLVAHERTCMVKQTPFIPYDFLRSDHEGKQLFGEDVILTPRNLAAQMGFDSPLVGKGDLRSFPSLAPALVPKEVVFAEEPIEMGFMETIGQAKGQTRCICGKSEKSVPGVMVQCGKCEYWLHTRCLKVKARDLPDEYFCPACVGNDEIGDDE